MPLRSGARRALGVGLPKLRTGVEVVADIDGDRFEKTAYTRAAEKRIGRLCMAGLRRRVVSGDYLGAGKMDGRVKPGHDKRG